MGFSVNGQPHEHVTSEVVDESKGQVDSRQLILGHTMAKIAVGASEVITPVRSQTVSTEGLLFHRLCLLE